MDCHFICRNSLCVLIAIAAVACTNVHRQPVFPLLPSTEPLTCQEIVAEKDRAYASLDKLYPQMKRESHHDPKYWLDNLFPGMFKAKRSTPRLSEFHNLATHYKLLTFMASAQKCPTLPDLTWDLLTRAYSDDRHVLDLK